MSSSSVPIYCVQLSFGGWSTRRNEKGETSAHAHLKLDKEWYKQTRDSEFLTELPILSCFRVNPENNFEEDT